MGHEKLKFLVDVGVGTKLENFLTSEGYDTKWARMQRARLVAYPDF